MNAVALKIQLSDADKEHLAEFALLLSLLPKHIAHGFFDQFLRLLGSARLEVDIPGAAAATGACNQVIGLRIGGYAELVAAARSAVEC